MPDTSRQTQNDAPQQQTATPAAQAPGPRQKKLIVGCGYLGRRVAERWLDAGDEVFAVTRSNRRAAEFIRAGLRPIVADVMRLETLVGLSAAATVLYAWATTVRRISASRKFICGAWSMFSTRSLRTQGESFT